MFALRSISPALQRCTDRVLVNLRRRKIARGSKGECHLVDCRGELSTFYKFPLLSSSDRQSHVVPHDSQRAWLHRIQPKSATQPLADLAVDRCRTDKEKPLLA